MRFEICKECVKKYNDKEKPQRKGYKYFLWQEICPYFAAKLDKKLKNIDNGMGSLATTKQNFNALFNKPNQLKHNNKQNKAIFDLLQNISDDNLKETINKLLQKDYENFKEEMKKD